MQSIKSSTSLRPQTVIEPSKGLLGINLKELWKYRELLWMLALREVSLRYRQTFLGVTWVVLQPLLTTAIFTVIFGTLMNAPSEGLPYSIFAFAGLLPWNLFAQSLQRAGVSLTRDIRLITKIFFPRVIIPVANSISTLVDFLVSCVLMFILMLIYKIPVTWALLSLPLFLVFNMLLAIGVGLIFAALNVYYRDFTYVLPFVIQVWMFASPLAYSAKLIPESWSWVYSLNPIVGIIDGFRWAIFGTIDFPVKSFVFSMITSLLLFFIGLAVFHRLERKFADVI